MPAVVVVIGAIIAFVGALLTESDRRRFQREQHEKSNEIERLNKEIMHSVTGGDSFCYLGLVSLGVDEANTAILTVIHQGEYPLFDVSFRMTDLQEMRIAPDQKQYMQRSLSKNARVGSIGPRSALPISDWQLPDTDEQSYNVVFNARNGFFTQLLRLKRVDGEWKAATRVQKEPTDGGESPILHEQVDDGFPRNEQGEVDWS